MAEALVGVVLVTVIAYGLWRLLSRPSTSGPTHGRSPSAAPGGNDRRGALRDFDNDQRHRGKL